MASATYSLVDEPHPGRLAPLAADPVWPLLAFMFGGAWLGWIWFGVNGSALGSPTRRRQWLLIVAGIAGTLVIGLAGGFAIANKLLGRELSWIVLAAVTLWKTAVSYGVYALQREGAGLLSGSGHRLRNGVLVVVLGFLARPAVAALVPQGVLALVVI